jgi:hypothetical protein
MKCLCLSHLCIVLNRLCFMPYYVWNCGQKDSSGNRAGTGLTCELSLYEPSATHAENIIRNDSCRTFDSSRRPQKLLPADALKFGIAGWNMARTRVFIHAVFLFVLFCEGRGLMYY